MTLESFRFKKKTARRGEDHETNQAAETVGTRTELLTNGGKLLMSQQVSTARFSKKKTLVRTRTGIRT
jgi:hypothetical protein